jgi:hypothetical protein
MKPISFPYNKSCSSKKKKKKQKDTALSIFCFFRLFCQILSREIQGID